MSNDLTVAGSIAGYVKEDPSQSMWMFSDATNAGVVYLDYVNGTNSRTIDFQNGLFYGNWDLTAGQYKRTVGSATNELLYGATVNSPHTATTNDGILALTIKATGSGFPLTNDASAAGFDLQGVGAFSAQNATISNSASINNDLVVSDRATIADLRATDSIIASLVVGDLVVTNHQDIYDTTTIYLTTNIYATRTAGRHPPPPASSMRFKRQYTNVYVWLASGIGHTVMRGAAWRRSTQT